jgi:hypothetical protein
MDGTVGVKGFDSHLDFSPVEVVKHLEWASLLVGMPDFKRESNRKPVAARGHKNRWSS